LSETYLDASEIFEYNAKHILIMTEFKVCCGE